MKTLLTAALISLSTSAFAQTAAEPAPTPASITVPMIFLDGENSNQTAGEVVISHSEYGAVFAPKIKGLPQGVYGFHVHEKPSCAAAKKDGKMVAGLGAGGHWDPHKTGAHKGPWDDGGHLGDLPALAVDAQGNIQKVVAPRIKNIADLRRHTLIIHAGGDNYSDQPVASGGSGARKFCGIIR